MSKRVSLQFFLNTEEPINDTSRRQQRYKPTVHYAMVVFRRGVV